VWDGRRQGSSTTAVCAPWPCKRTQDGLRWPQARGKMDHPPAHRIMALPTSVPAQPSSPSALMAMSVANLWCSPCTVRVCACDRCGRGCETRQGVQCSQAGELVLETLLLSMDHTRPTNHLQAGQRAAPLRGGARTCAFM